MVASHAQPDWGLNTQPFSYGMRLQPTEPPRPEQRYSQSCPSCPDFGAHLEAPDMCCLKGVLSMHVPGGERLPHFVPRRSEQLLVAHGKHRGWVFFCSAASAEAELRSREAGAACSCPMFIDRELGTSGLSISARGSAAASA